jgi:hypothetical protein
VEGVSCGCLLEGRLVGLFGSLVGAPCECRVFFGCSLLYFLCNRVAPLIIL